MSTEGPTWGTEFATAFVAAQSEMTEITKGRTADMGTYRYSFADIADVLSDVRPVLNKHGLAITQAEVTNGRDVETWTTILHVSGQYRTDGPLAFNGGSNPQQAGSAITYARRYAALASLGLASEDDDGAKAANEPTATRRGRPEPREPEPPAEPKEPKVKTPGQLLMDRVLDADGPTKAKVAAFAAENGKKYTAPAFDADPVYAEQVADILNQQVAA